MSDPVPHAGEAHMQIPPKCGFFFFKAVVLQLASPHKGPPADSAFDIKLTLCEQWTVSDAGGHIQPRYRTERRLFEMAGRKTSPETVWSCSHKNSGTMKVC